MRIVVTDLVKQRDASVVAALRPKNLADLPSSL